MSKLLILDFDDTLLDTQQSKLALAKAINLSPEQWQIAYDGFMADNHVFDPAGFLQGVTSTERDAFYDTVKHIERYVFRDTLPFVQQAVDNGWDVRILSAGSKDWQMQKIEHVRWPETVGIQIVESDKASVIAQWLRESDFERVVFIDDKLAHLEAVLATEPSVECYLMVREGSGISPAVKYGKMITELNSELL